MAEDNLMMVLLEVTYQDALVPEFECYTLYRFLDEAPHFEECQEMLDQCADLPGVTFKVTYLPVPETPPPLNHYGAGFIQ